MSEHMPPSESPAMASEPLPVAALKWVRMNFGTSSVTYVSAFPRGLLTHSVSLVNEPFSSGITMIGAMP